MVILHRKLYLVTDKGRDFLKSLDLSKEENFRYWEILHAVDGGFVSKTDRMLRILIRRGLVEEYTGSPDQLLDEVRDKKLGEALKTYKKLAFEEEPSDREVRSAVGYLLSSGIIPETGSSLRELRKEFKESKTPSERRIILDTLVNYMHDEQADALASDRAAQRFLNWLSDIEVKE